VLPFFGKHLEFDAPPPPTSPEVAGDRGSGPYPAVMEVDPTLARHVIYRPADLDRMGDRKLGVYVWGNGGCSDDGASVRNHLLEIASQDRKSTRLNSSHVKISYAVFCLQKKKR